MKGEEDFVENYYRSLAVRFIYYGARRILSLILLASVKPADLNAQKYCLSEVMIIFIFPD